MKKNLLSFVLAILSTGVFATLSTPQLSLPADSATVIMPNAFLKWQPVTNATFYRIQVDTSVNFTNPQNLISIPTGFYCANLLFGTKYYWRIKAKNPTDSSVWSSSFLFTTFYNQFTLNSPKMVNAKATFTVSANADITSDVITINGVNLTEGLHFVAGGTANATATNIANAININGSLIGVVTAVATTNKVDVWALANGTLGNGMPVAFTAGGAAGGSWSGATLINGSFGISAVKGNLTWNAITGVNFYQYEIDTSATFNSPKNKKGIVPFGTNLAEVDQLFFDTYYHWRLRAIHAQDTSGWSAYNTFKTPSEIVHNSPAPSFANAMPNQTMKWNLMAGVQEYDVQYDTTLNFNSTQLKTIYNVFSPVDNANGIKLLFGQKYYWKVRGVHDFDVSGWSTPWNFTTINQIPLYQPANTSSTSSPIPTFVWKNVTGINKYELQLDVNNNFTNPTTYTVNQGGSDSAYTLQNALVMNQVYFWRVRAMHGNDTSSWSAPFSFTASNTSVAEITSGAVLNVFPNPAKDVVNISLSNSTSSKISVAIIDMLGKTVLENNYNVNSSSKNISIDLRNFNQGIYFINVTTEVEKLTKRMVINK